MTTSNVLKGRLRDRKWANTSKSLSDYLYFEEDPWEATQLSNDHLTIISIVCDSTGKELSKTLEFRSIGQILWLSFLFDFTENQTILKELQIKRASREIVQRSVRKRRLVP